MSKKMSNGLGIQPNKFDKMYRGRNISLTTSLLDALKRMDEFDCKLLIVLDDNKFLGLLSAGDIQRAIINNKSLNTEISKVLRKDIKTGKPNDSLNSIKELMKSYRMEFYPIIDSNGVVIKIHFWNDLFLNEKTEKVKFKCPVVVMAGGFGKRMLPLTNVIPKAMIPIGDKTMLEEIFERFSEHGCSDFFLSVNYKSDLIKYYLEQQNLSYNIEYFKDTKPLGTAGSLVMLKGKIKETFFLNNCDIIIEDDYAQILDYHKAQGNLITLVAAIKSYNIPYGTVESGENGILTDLKEKPELNFLINSGMYILEPSTLDLIPNGKMYHITDLIKQIQNQGGKVGVFPVSEKAWIDMGDWQEYIQAIK